MTRIFAMLASVAIMGLSLTVGRAAEAPVPPRINFIATPASQLHLGMAADEVIRVMGGAAKETDFELDSIQIRKLEFTGAIPGQLILSDGKLSRVTLDPFRMQEAALPSFIRQAWPGFASSAVRRALGDPAVVLRHSFFGIEVDQWIYSRAGGTDASVFFRSDRVIGRSAGRDVPADLFRVDLPLLADSESPISAPRPGTTAHDIEETYGAPRYRVDYLRNGQPASREVYEIAKTGSFVGFTFVDGVIIELEDLGRMPDDPSFQGL